MRRTRPSLEFLESRCVPAVWGNPWPAPERLTISFAPDGTDVSGQKSSLFEHFKNTLSEAAWQREVLRAFQTWAARVNINVSVVKDDGLAFGQPSAAQGGVKAGDIRVGAAQLSGGELAVGTPFDLLSDWSGDVLLNTDFLFNKGGTGGAYDLYTVVLQEAGHALGLGNSPNASSVMYTTYQGPRTGLSPEDVTSLQSLYGIRRDDRFEGPEAARIKFISDADEFRGTDPTAGPEPWVVRGDLTRPGDVDTFRFTQPAGLNDFSVELRTSGLSLLKARLRVYNSSMQLLKTVTATDPLDGDLTAFVSGARPGRTYYVKVEAAADDEFGVGSYHLAAGKETHEALFPGEPNFINDDRGDDDDDDIGTVVDLGGAASVGAQWEAAHEASISFATDVDRYRVVAPADADSSTVMVVSVWGLEPGKLDPVVSVREEGSSALLPVNVLRNDGNTFTVQVNGLTAGGAYLVTVAPADPNGSAKEGNYFLGVDFRREAVPLKTFAEGTLTQADRQQLFTLENNSTQLYHFLLTSQSSNPTVASAIRLTVYDENQQVVFTLAARAGDAVSTDVLLAPGTYTVRFVAATQNGEPLPELAFRLAGIVRSNPIGPVIENPIGVPVGSPPPPTPYDYLWQYYGTTVAWLSLLDPYANPWSGL